MKVVKQLWIGFLIIGCIACQTTSSNKNNQEAKLIEHQLSGKAQGTTYTVKYISENKVSGLKKKLDSLLDAIDRSMSTYLDNSLITKLNRGDSIHMDSNFKAVFLQSKKISALTNGTFDPTIAPLIEAWGFDYANAENMDSTQVKEILSYCGFNRFELKGNWLVKKHPAAKLNFNAIAQGYAVDLMADIFHKEGLKHHYVELGGEVKVSGKNSHKSDWRIGIDRPLGKNLERKLSAIVSLKNQAMVTSGNYRNYRIIDGKKYYHTIDPKSGYPVTHSLLSATVIAEQASIADALATAFMVMGFKKTKTFLKNNPKYQAVLIYSKDEEEIEIDYSPSLQGKIQLVD